MSLLETVDLQSGYGRIPVLHGVSIEVGQGEMVGVLGANGAGKSTLMKTIARVLWAISGEIIFDGKPVTKLRPHEMTALGLGYVPQENNIFPDLTVEENLLMAGFIAKDGRSRLQRGYDRFPILGERKSQKGGTLSGGERQMLATGCALTLDPKLLILDEPTSGLSPQVTEALVEGIVKINKEGTAILWVVEENPREVLRHCSRAYFLDSGTVARSDTSAALLADPNLNEMFLGHAHKA
jgi:ABC-type branched-subunit amino acid transport system ATPase component